MSAAASPVPTIEDIIQTCLLAWRGHPSYAWAGECGIFADWLWTDLTRAGITQVAIDSFDNELTSDAPVKAPPGTTLEQLAALKVFEGLNHVWITVDGRHFDAASPAGVDDVTELRHFKQVMVEMLKMRDPALLETLIKEHTWWQEADTLLQDFLAMADEREACWEPN